MKASKIYSIDTFVGESIAQSPIDAETVTLRGGAKIGVEGDLALISEYSFDVSRCSEFLKMLYPKVRVPKDMPVELVTPIIEHQLRERSEFKVSVRNKKIVNFQPNNFPLGLAKLCERVEGVTKSSDLSKMSSVGKDRVTIYSVDKQLTQKPKVNDVVCGGLALEAKVNGNLSVYPFSFRLWCSNGAVHIEKDKSWSVIFNGNGVDPQGWFENIESGYKAYMDDTLIRISKLVGVSLDVRDANSFLNVLIPNRTLRVPRSVISDISSRINRDSISNAYDMWNRTTGMLSEFSHDNPEESFRYLRYGGAVGDVLSDPGFEGDVDCSECGTSVARVGRKK